MPLVQIHIRESLGHLTIQKKGIYFFLMNINPSKAPGPDKIQNYVLKECASEVTTAVTCLFQKSLDSGTLPDGWISANIAPIYKKGDRHLAENYRPVSLTCVLPKLLQHIVCRAMLVHFHLKFLQTETNLVVDGEASAKADVASGVPQGTVIGPIMFLVLRPPRQNPIHRQIICRWLPAVPENQVHRRPPNPPTLWTWNYGRKSGEWCLTPKSVVFCQFLKKSSHFYILDNTILSDVKSYLYLGLNIDLYHDLKWSNRINSVCKKAGSTLCFIRHNLKHYPKTTRHMAYISLVRSLLEYGAIIWDPYTQRDINRFERVQRQSGRFISGDYWSRTPGSMSNMLKELSHLVSIFWVSFSHPWSEYSKIIAINVAFGLYCKTI